MKYSNFLWKLLCTVLIVICLICYQYTAVAGQKKTAIRESEIQAVESWNSQVRALESEADAAASETETTETSDPATESQTSVQSEKES